VTSQAGNKVMFFAGFGELPWRKHAVQESGPAQVDVRKQASDGEAVGEGNTKGQVA